MHPEGNSSEQTVGKALPQKRRYTTEEGFGSRHDPTDRFTYWPHRIARGGTVLAPGDPTEAVRFIDVRDLALWLGLVSRPLTETIRDTLTWESGRPASRQ